MELLNRVYMVNDYLQKKSVQLVTQVNRKWGVMLAYRYRFKTFPDLKNPKTFNEKIQWLKLNTYYENPLVTKLVDKYEVKNYLKNIGLGEYIAPTIGVYESMNEVDWNQLPEKFVIKCNHASGYNMVITDKLHCSKEKVYNTVNGWMKKEYGKEYAEFQYKDVVRKIVIEEYLGDDLQEYKFFCFNGVPEVFYLTVEDKDDRELKYYDFFDRNKKNLGIEFLGHLPSPYPTEFSSHLDEMIDLATKLSTGFPFVRIDFFVVKDKVYFAEFTFIPTGGYMRLKPENIDVEWGKMLNVM